jgi:hypothetical protein
MNREMTIPSSTLIITSTVYVNSDMTILVDPVIREQQCVDSILYYLKSPYLESIVVCDNSGFDFSTNKRILEAAAQSGKQTEFLCFAGEKQTIAAKGKGYGEGEMMAYILMESRLLKRAGASFFKITGRLLVLNFDAIARKVKPGRSYFQRVGRNPFVNLKKVDTRFYYCNVGLFESHLLHAYKVVNDREGRYLEHVYYEALQGQPSPYTGFGVPPLFGGTSGSTGLSYSIGPLKRFAEVIINYLAGNRF